MPPRKKDYVNRRYGKLLILEELPPVPYTNPKTRKTLNRRVFRCICDCGNEAIKKMRVIKASNCPQCKQCDNQANSTRQKGIPQGKRVKLQGQKFGNLNVLDAYQTDKNGHHKLLCKCDCGTEKYVYQTHLIRGNTASCGCQQGKSGSDSPRWKGVGEISAGWFYDKVGKFADPNHPRHKEVGIDIQYIWDLFLAQKSRCVYSGLQLTFPNKNTNEENTESTASLDRIDSSLGYIKGNVQWVHKQINIMKNTFSDTDFVLFCSLVYLNQDANYRYMIEEELGLEPTRLHNATGQK